MLDNPVWLYWGRCAVTAVNTHRLKFLQLNGTRWLDICSGSLQIAYNAQNTISPFQPQIACNKCSVHLQTPTGCPSKQQQTQFAINRLNPLFSIKSQQISLQYCTISVTQNELWLFPFCKCADRYAAGVAKILRFSIDNFMGKCHPFSTCQKFMHMSAHTVAKVRQENRHKNRIVKQKVVQFAG